MGIGRGRLCLQDLSSRLLLPFRRCRLHQWIWFGDLRARWRGFGCPLVDGNTLLYLLRLEDWLLADLCFGCSWLLSFSACSDFVGCERLWDWRVKINRSDGHTRVLLWNSIEIHSIIMIILDKQTRVWICLVFCIWIRLNSRSICIRRRICIDQHNSLLMFMSHQTNWLLLLQWSGSSDNHISLVVRDKVDLLDVHAWRHAIWVVDFFWVYWEVVVVAAFSSLRGIWTVVVPHSTCTAAETRTTA